MAAQIYGSAQLLYLWLKILPSSLHSSLKPGFHRSISAILMFTFASLQHKYRAEFGLNCDSAHRFLIQIHITTLRVLWSISHLIPFLRHHPHITVWATVIELKYRKGHLLDYLCARMLLETLRPEECNTTKTAYLLQKKKNSTVISQFLDLCYLSLCLEGFAAGRRKRRVLNVLWMFGL